MRQPSLWRRRSLTTVCDRSLVDDTARRDVDADVRGASYPPLPSSSAWSPAHCSGPSPRGGVPLQCGSCSASARAR